MKRTSEDAVSPVIGTILMVAIVVTLAAVVFVLAQHFANRQSKEAPNVHFQTDNGASTAKILTAPASDQLDWYRDIVISGSCDPLLNGHPFPTSEGTPVQASDVLTCSSGEDLKLAATQPDGNVLLYEHEFP